MSEYVDREGVVISWANARGLVRSAYDGSRVVRGRVVYGESRTSQAEAQEADLNWLVKRWMATGGLPEVKPLSFGDVSEAVSYVDVIDRLKLVSEMFMKLPANIREYFHNDAAVFADFVADPSNIEEGREIGLYAPEAAAAAPAGEETPPA